MSDAATCTRCGWTYSTTTGGHFCLFNAANGDPLARIATLEADLVRAHEALDRRDAVASRLEARIAELTRELCEWKRNARNANDEWQSAMRLQGRDAMALAAARVERDEEVGLLLGRLEWAGQVDGWRACPCCGAIEGPHYLACELSRLLARLAAAPEKETTP